VSNETVTYLVGACLAVLGLAIFCVLVVFPAVASYRRLLERVAAAVLSLYVLAALVGIGVVLGGLVVVEWPRIF
jgi:surface polysaccharide O-acyltransferase-like enzyme